MSRPNRLNSSSRSRARTFVASLAHRVRLTEGTKVVSHHSGFDLADWRFLAEASVALDDAASVDELQSVVLRLVVPKAADFCVLRIHAGLASALCATARAAHARAELLPFLRRSTPGRDELLSRRHPANRVQVTGVPDWGDVDERRLELVASDSEHLKLLRAMGPTSAMVVPVARRGRVLGSLTLVATRHSGRRYTRGDVALASELARRAAIALERCAQYEAARRAITDQRVLLALTSHDLKDPLSTVQLVLELVRERGIDSGKSEPDGLIRSQLDAAAGAAARMRRLVERTLDAARAGGIDEPPAQTERPTLRLLEELIEQYMPQARASRVELSLETHETLPPIALEGDSLQRAVANLIGNALKFTPAGGHVVVRAKAMDHSVKFTVADTGPGISQEDRRSLLAPGWKPRLSSASGSGLGLRIARTIVRAAGGDIGFQPSARGGTAFWVTVPTR
jgi:signal transduction histidine kinase